MAAALEAGETARVVGVVDGDTVVLESGAVVRLVGIQAPKLPLGRPGSPEEVARLVGALFREDIPYLTGETIYLDGGHGIAH